MTFRNTVFSAVVVGIIVGSLYGLFQQYQINPIIYAAESFEVSDIEAPANTTDTHNDSEAIHSHDHGDGTGWSPANKLQRVTATLVANIMAAITFSLIL
ncbi:MAG: putative cobalt transporter CbtA, partial [Gammaproteobacteria bacterium]